MPSISPLPHPEAGPHSLHTSLEAKAAPRIQFIDKQSLNYIVKSGIAGGVAGCAAKTLIAPLDRVKILFQTSNPEFTKYAGSMTGLLKASKRIYAMDGVMGLFQGHSATLLRIFPYAAIKFVAYEQIRTLLIPTDEYETAGRRLLAGSLSGLTSVACTYPLDLIRVRLAFSTKHKHAGVVPRGRLLSTIASIYNEAPPARETDPNFVKYARKSLPSFAVQVSNFYRGFVPTIIGMIPYAGVSFYTHDLIHDIFRSPLLANVTVRQVASRSFVSKRSSDEAEFKSSHDQRAPLKAWAQLIAGGLAGMCSQTAAYPFEVIRRRMQVGGVVNDGQFYNVKLLSKVIWREKGFRGFFVGLSIGYIKVVPMVACSFFVYERMKTGLGI
ncbi:hypothetical protein BABINDRAFT_41352 [Babjeviella inositovora NRRL Y-12698]|uniref:Mitochondrial carrier protein LEU5 n=1 Tax=Babjeviella inositovora NRRL Y-12698 TaxID=984486 RepID=A0A1E3QJA2_9ASCO|nr:uncharacterized protein BABINDRAFT_41352 [Babjeviella inositovora NRRL Y-12698]ODQ77688.1 hypothetical protein BABINDRAFT_41352 [Babjeviella inositovora NRRL Y-12698]